MSNKITEMDEKKIKRKQYTKEYWQRPEVKTRKRKQQSKKYWKNKIPFQEASKRWYLKNRTEQIEKQKKSADKKKK